MRAIVRAGVAVAAVISNRPDAAGLAFAREQGIATSVVDHKAFDSRDAFDAALMEKIDSFSPDLLVLAGFMRVLGQKFVKHYAGQSTLNPAYRRHCPGGMVNIHPSLLPAFQGLHTHERAIAAGCRFAGATVHRVTAVLDEGEILAQAVVPILHGDTAQSLAARVLTQEHLIYPKVIAAILGAIHGAIFGSMPVH